MDGEEWGGGGRRGGWEGGEGGHRDSYVFNDIVLQFRNRTGHALHLLLTALLVLAQLLSRLLWIGFFKGGGGGEGALLETFHLRAQPRDRFGHGHRQQPF